MEARCSDQISLNHRFAPCTSLLYYPSYLWLKMLKQELSKDIIIENVVEFTLICNGIGKKSLIFCCARCE